MSVSNFFIVGAAKSGTSSLVNYFSQHPSIFFPSIKEPYYYVDGFGINSQAEYDRLYKKSCNYKIMGDASTGYLFEPGCAEKIKSDSPEAKILISLRNPIDMAFSLWRYMSMVGNEADSFECAIKQTDHRKTKDFIENAAAWPKNYLYMDRGKYFGQVNRYINVFGTDNVKVIIFEDWIKNIDHICIDLFNFLGVKSDVEIHHSIKKNQGGIAKFKFLHQLLQNEYPVLKKMIPVEFRDRARKFVRDINRKDSSEEIIQPETRNELRQIFKEDVNRLGKMLNKKLWDEYY